MKKIYLLLVLLLQIIAIENSIAQCTNAPYGAYGALTPNCTGAYQNATTCGYRGEYSTITVTAGNAYSFQSSVGTDIVTITTTANTVLASATGTANWTATFSGQVRFYTHGAGCATGSGCRTRRVMCTGPPPPAITPPVCYDMTGNTGGFTNGLGGNPWYFGGTGTPSSGTGPQGADASGGSGFAFTESSGFYNTTYGMTGYFDLSAGNYQMTFDYHMYGAAMGNLRVLVNGAQVFIVSGNQGNTWNSAVIDLSGYLGTSVGIAILSTTGTSYTSDCAIDNICINTAGGPVPGCTDPAALNYNPLATLSDGSCVYAPANDLVCSATAITCGATLSGTTVNATNSGTGEGGSCGTAQTQPGVWYVVAGNGQTMTASLCATAWDSKMSVYSGTNCSTLTCVGGNDDGGPACTGTSASYSWPSVSGTNYYILVHGYSSTSAFSINLSCVTPTPPPANDDCANAQSITIQCPAAATAVSGTTANATEEAMADPSCDPGTIRDVWYTFNSGNNSSVDLSVTLGTASWLGGEIHTTCGTPATGLIPVCDYDLLNPAPTNISGLTPNTDYRLRLFNNVDWDIAGTFTFTLTNTGNSTAPAITLMPGTYCPNTDITLSAAGGTSGAGAVINWYSGANGTGTLLGTGGSVVVAPTATTTYYVRREGLCNNSADDAITINVKNFVYAANGTSASNYCTDNNGWNHFYNGDDIIFSVEGDLSGAPLGYPIATINNNSAFYQETEGPGTAAGCVNNENPNEERFEMSRSWNLDFGGGTQNGTYKIRFYYPPAEKTAIENAANAWMANYVFCSYDYKYPFEPFYWFKNTTSNYTAPDYDGDHYSATVSSTNSGINYSEWNNITSFSGGSGAIIVLPSNTLLPVELVDFSSRCIDGDVAIEWSTASENNSMHFEVESSVDAFNWEAIAVVDAAQFSTSLIDYAILHEGAAREKNYYRLKQVDADGAYEYYSIIYSDCGSDLDGAPIIFPNPSENNFTIDFGGSGMKGIVQLTLVSMEGKEISNRQLNLGEGVSTFQINNLELRPGLYLIKMTDMTGKLFIIKHRFN